MKQKKVQLSYHLMMAPAMIFLVIFSIIPMFGVIMAFQSYVPAKGILHSKWVGLDNFKYMFSLPDCGQIFQNTLIIAIAKIVFGTIAAVLFSLLLNEIRVKWFKKSVQTIVYLPNFLSWVVLSTIILNIFSISGPINGILGTFGIEPILFMGSNTWFRSMLIGTDVWKGFGYGSIIYLAALTGIDPTLYEAASVDGASRFKQLLNITLPSLVPTIIVMTALNLGNILNAGFDQIYTLYNPLVYQTSDVIDTYVYRVGLIQRQYSLATAVGLLKSVVSFILIVSANEMSKKLTNQRIF